MTKMSVLDYLSNLEPILEMSHFGPRLQDPFQFKTEEVLRFNESSDNYTQYASGRLMSCGRADSPIYEHLKGIDKALEDYLNESRHVATCLEPLCDKIVETLKSMFLEDRIEQENIVEVDSNDLSRLFTFKNHSRDVTVKFKMYLMISKEIGELGRHVKIPNKDEYVLVVNYSLLASRDGYRELRSTIVHELVHLIDETRSGSVIPYYEGVDNNSLAGDFLYLFSPKEINARMSEIHYVIKDGHYTRNDIKLLLASFDKKIEDYKRRTKSAIVKDPLKPIYDLEKLWNLVTLYDQMTWTIMRMENLDQEEKRLFVDDILKGSEKFIRAAKERDDYTNSIDDSADKAMKSFFGISSSMTTNKAMKRIIEKAKNILELYTRKLRIIFKDLLLFSERVS